MLLRNLLLLLLLIIGFMNAAPVFANADYYLQFEIYRFQQKIESGKDFVSAREHTWSKGLQRSYLTLTCTTKADGRVDKHYSTVDHFAGIRVTHQIKDGKLHLQLTRIDVQPKLTEIRSLRKDECRQLAPIVTTMNENYVTPINEASNKNYAFGKEMSFRISLLPIEAAR